MHPAPTDLVGRTVGPYELERLLGQGGFAWVFVGRELDGTPVAVKILKPRYGADPAFEIRFRNEAETAAKLDHPNIIRIRFVARSGGYVYFAMDLCADSLGARLAREGPLTERDVVRIATDVARGLEFAHRQGVIHRDLKPDNILIHSDGSAVISDFGIARAVSGYVASTGVNMTIGTPHYLSPEQAQGRPVDQRADFYALGITLYKAATRRRCSPISGTSPRASPVPWYGASAPRRTSGWRRWARTSDGRPGGSWRRSFWDWRSWC